MVLPKHLRVLSILVGMSLMMACADQKGFQARITKPEDLLRQKGIDPKSEEGQQFIKERLAAAGKTSPQEVVIPPAHVNQAQNGAQDAGDTTASKGSPQDQEMVQGFAKIVREAVASGKAPEAGKAVNPKVMPPPSAAELAERTRLEKVEKLKVIQASLNPKVNEILKGIDVRIVAGGDVKAEAKAQVHKVSVGINLVLQNKAFLSNAEGVLTPKNQFKKTDIVPLKVTREFDATDMNETKIAKIEYFAACESESEMCETVVVMILFNRADNSKISFVGRFRFDGQGLGTALGDQLKSVAQAQEEFAKKQVAAAAPAASPAASAAASQSVAGAKIPEAGQTGNGQKLLEAMRKQDAKKVEADLKAYLEKLDEQDKAKAKVAADLSAHLENLDNEDQQKAQAASPPQAAASAASSATSAPAAGESDGIGQWFVDVGNSIWDSVSSIWGPTTPARKTDLVTPAKTSAPMRYKN